MDRIGYYFIVPLLLAIVYLGGTISGRSRHSRTLYLWVYEFFLALTALYLTPIGVVPLWHSVVALIGALAVIRLLRWVIGRDRLLPDRAFIWRQYPILFHLLSLLLVLIACMGRTNRLSPIALRTILIAAPMLCVIVERLSYILHKGHHPADETQ